MGLRLFIVPVLAYAARQISQMQQKGVRSYLNGPLTGFKYIIDQINCELTNGIRGYLQMKSKKRGMGSAKSDMGFPLREKNIQNFKRS